ncbi:MAG: hypothetical protein WBB28_07220 [Crinalium sp.]
MSAKLEIVKVIKAGTNTSLTDSTNTAKSWWQEDFVTIEPDTDELILTVSRSKALIGTINEKAIKQLNFAGYSVLRVRGELREYPSLYIPLSFDYQWQGIKTILENCGYKVTVIAG